MTALGPRFDEALAYAADAHAGQVRKGTSIPFVAHLLAVTALVLEDDGDEDHAIAALLHDAPEDAGGRDRLDDIRRRFGDRVADIVEACSDTFEVPKPAWRPRKERYLTHLETAPDDVLRVSLADKVHNLRRSCSTTSASATRSGHASPRAPTSSGTTAHLPSSSSGDDRVCARPS
jgi:(p)ppGpp synthase/HD superfamily hydrolase